MKKQLPKFKNEDEEREFWSKNDSAEYLDWDTAEKTSFSNLPSALDLLHEGRELRDAQLMLVVEGEKHFRDIALEKGVNWDSLTRD
ncbi:MAG: hypothetical protein HYZ22_07440, partial [Chloroflexi bacterium]|nr:hypothetical protein [Chloroflexota bacterium]